MLANAARNARFVARPAHCFQNVPCEGRCNGRFSALSSREVRQGVYCCRMCKHAGENGGRESHGHKCEKLTVTDDYFTQCQGLLNAQISPAENASITLTANVSRLARTFAEARSETLAGVERSRYLDSIRDLPESRVPCRNHAQCGFEMHRDPRISRCQFCCQACSLSHRSEHGIRCELLRSSGADLSHWTNYEICGDVAGRDSWEGYDNAPASNGQWAEPLQR